MKPIIDIQNTETPMLPIAAGNRDAARKAIIHKQIWTRWTCQLCITYVSFQSATKFKIDCATKKLQDAVAPIVYRIDIRPVKNAANRCVEAGNIM